MIVPTTHQIPWRPIGWSAAAALLAVPAIAMQFTSEVQWTALDFIAMGALIGGVGLVFELFARQSVSGAYRAASGVMLLGGFLTIWINLAVGIIGEADNPANLMFAAVLAIVAGGAAGSGLKAAGMKRTLFVAAVAQLLAGIAALAGGAAAIEGPLWPRVMIGFTALFTCLWLASAALYGRAARRD